MYFVWRRNDGYIGCSNGRMPDGWRTTDGRDISFEKLRESEDWEKCYEFMVRERRAVISWGA
jgi:hypothetical protein